MREPYDVVIVGAGHNGLVAAFCLARAGLRTIVVERRSIVGGACTTEEFAPGFKASPGAYVLDAPGCDLAGLTATADLAGSVRPA